VFFEPVQVALGAPVLPVQLLGAQRDVQQAGFAQDVVRVAEALPLGVHATLAVWTVFRRADLPGDRPENAARGFGDRRGGVNLCLVNDRRRPLSGRAAAGAGSCGGERKSALERRRSGAGWSGDTGGGGARVTSTTTQVSLMLLSLTVLMVVGGQTAPPL